MGDDFGSFAGTRQRAGNHSGDSDVETQQMFGGFGSLGAASIGELGVGTPLPFAQHVPL